VETCVNIKSLLPLTESAVSRCLHRHGANHNKNNKTQKPLKFAGVPQTRQQISAVSKPMFTIIMSTCGGGIEFHKFFPIVDTCLSCEDTARQSVLWC